MARPQKMGISYFSFDVDIFEDEKLFDVTNELGPLGEVIYIRLLCLIYKNGYYLKFESLDKLASMLIKSIGNRWVRGKETVVQVIPFLAKCNLFSLELMQENVLTSASIQMRYLKATERRQSINNLEYWLLPKNYTSAGLLNVHKNKEIDNNNGVNVYNNSFNVDGGTQSKVKESKVKESNNNTTTNIDVSENKELENAIVKDDGGGAVKYYMKTINPMISNKTREAFEDYANNGLTDELIIEAIDEALDKGKRDWHYIKAILDRCIIKGIKTLEEYRIAQIEFKHNKKQNSPAQHKNISNREKGLNFLKQAYEKEKEKMNYEQD